MTLNKKSGLIIFYLVNEYHSDNKKRIKSTLKLKIAYIVKSQYQGKRIILL